MDHYVIFLPNRANLKKKGTIVNTYAETTDIDWDIIVNWDLKSRWNLKACNITRDENKMSNRLSQSAYWSQILKNYPLT